MAVPAQGIRDHAVKGVLIVTQSNIDGFSQCEPSAIAGCQLHSCRTAPHITPHKFAWQFSPPRQFGRSIPAALFIGPFIPEPSNLKGADNLLKIKNTKPLDAASSPTEIQNFYYSFILMVSALNPFRILNAMFHCVTMSEAGALSVIPL